MGRKKLSKEVKKELIKWLLRYALIIAITAFLQGTLQTVAPREDLNGWFDHLISVLFGLWLGILMYMSISGWMNAQEVKEMSIVKAENRQLRREIQQLMDHFW